MKIPFVKVLHYTPFLSILLSSVFLSGRIIAQGGSPEETGRLKKHAQQVTIIRDSFGIPHIYGKTDADAVFGLIYAQCEDDFKRVEMNYIEKLGRMSEIKGESALPGDLYVKLIIDSSDAVKDYTKSPPWLKKLLNAWADGINFFLFKHPQIKPALLNHFQPWYPLLWTDGSIGAISTGNITEKDVAAFYLSGTPDIALEPRLNEERSSGSNGFAVAPSRTANGNAILYINPHVTFYFRPEVQVHSEEGLNVYGAVTWGQFFIYQGFNEHCGWMHTSSNVDVSDMYIEKVNKQNGHLTYQYDGQSWPVMEKQIELNYKNGNTFLTKKIKAYSTIHGPVMAKRKGEWISVKSFNRSLSSLIQSWKRTRATGFGDFKRIMELRSNTSNNTVFADDQGNIAYWHGNYVPIRDKKLDWGKSVDGTTSATNWKGLHQLDEIVHVYNPASGWIQNCNSTPFTVSGTSSPKKEDYPAYMAPDGENFRAINAARLLSKEKNISIEKIISLGYDTKLSAFEILIPPLIRAFENNFHPGDTVFTQVREAIDLLKNWDYHSGINSVATTLAIYWAQGLPQDLQKVYIEQGEDDQVTRTKKYAATANPIELVNRFLTVLNELKSKYGRWDIAWGELNRYQHLSGDIDQQYDDSKPSLPVPFASSVWGMLPAYNSKTFPNTNKRYGISGNSFICAVEFVRKDSHGRKKIRARSLLAGGESGHPSSPHFNDQQEMYTKGKFKEVLFYKEDVLKHMERSYHPGE